MLYHIKFIKRPSGGECQVNIDEKELMTRYVEPYLNGEEIMISGTVLKQNEIRRILITQSDKSIDDIIARIEHEDEIDRSPYKLLRSSARWRAMDDAEDITDKILSAPPKKIVTVKSEKGSYVNIDRIEELRSIKNPSFDLSKLVRICEEINQNWANGNYFSVIALLRTILHHIAPIFGLVNFDQVASNYAGGPSFKKSMQHLLNSSKNIADTHLHSQAQKNEALPNDTQVDFRNDLDFLLSEIVRLTK